MLNYIQNTYRMRQSNRKKYYLFIGILLPIAVLLILMQLTNLGKILMGLDEINFVHICTNKDQLNKGLCDISDPSKKDICYSNHCIFGEIVRKRTFIRKPLDNNLLTQSRCFLAGGKFEQAKMGIPCDPPEEALCWGLGYRCAEKE